MKIAILGIGAVAKCCLHLLDKFVEVNASHIYLVERSNQRAHYTVNAFIARGAVYLECSLNCENTIRVLHDEIALQRGDVVIDLTTDTDMFHTMQICLEQGYRYLNTCIENSTDAVLLHYRNHERLAELIEPFRERPAQPTVLLDQGMNPGLISAFAKQGLIDIAEWVLGHKADPALRALSRDKNFSAIARYLKLEALHCSEADTQVAAVIPADTFVNTWSCPGFLVEALAPSQIAWGTHECTSVTGMQMPRKRVAVLPGQAWQTEAVSYVPHRVIHGMVIPHEEVFTLQKLLASEDYAPSICFVYEMNQHTRECMQRPLPLDKEGIVLTPAEHGLQGADKVGCLFVLAANPLTGEPSPWCWWSGSILHTTDPQFSATVIQVTAGILAGLKFMIENPNAGILFPEDIDHEQLLRDAGPFLGDLFSAPVDYRPSGTQFGAFLRTIDTAEIVATH